MKTNIILNHCHPIEAKKHLLFRTPTLIFALTSKTSSPDFQDATPELSIAPSRRAGYSLAASALRAFTRLAGPHLRALCRPYGTPLEIIQRRP